MAVKQLRVRRPEGGTRLLAKFRRPVPTFLMFTAPMLAGIVLGPFEDTNRIESYLDLLALLAFIVAVIQCIIALFKRSISKIATWTLIVIANMVLFTSDSIGYFQEMAYLYMHRDYYLQAVAVKRAQPDYPGFVIFETDSSFDAMHDFIFDESDSRAIHALLATSPLLSESIFVHCRYSARHLFDHFYSVFVGC